MFINQIHKQSKQRGRSGTTRGTTRPHNWPWAHQTWRQTSPGWKQSAGLSSTLRFLMEYLPKHSETLPFLSGAVRRPSGDAAVPPWRGEGKDTGEVFQDGDVPDVVVERVHGVVAVGTERDTSAGFRRFGVAAPEPPGVPVLFLKRLEGRHVVHFPEELAENGHLMGTPEKTRSTRGQPGGRCAARPLTCVWQFIMEQHLIILFRTCGRQSVLPGDHSYLLLLLLCILFSQSNQIQYNIILYNIQNRKTEKV